MSIELVCAEPTDSPQNTSYAWDISHALVTTYHPYCHSPGALTEYLKQKLRSQRAKRLGRSLPAQVEPSVQLERNMGLILEEGVTRMDPAKVAGIATWPTLTSVKQIRSFLGFCNFYRPFIYQFSHIARPLNELTRKDTLWTWGERQQEAFETLKKRITSEPVLKQPQLEQQFEVEVNASGYAIGAVLMQRDEKGKRHPVAYFSSTLNEAEQNYDIYTLELYAIV